MRQLLFFAITTALCVSNAWSADFQWLLDSPPVHSAKESADGLPDRTERIVDRYLKLPIEVPGFPIQNRVFEFLGGILARLHRRTDLRNANAELMNPEFRPGNLGADIDLLGPFCKRQGDYDFSLMAIVKIIDLDDRSQKTLLDRRTRKHVLDVLLNLRGPKPYDRFRLDFCFPIYIRDTENHRLMAETARLLTNEFIMAEHPASNHNLYDNKVNGTNERMAQTLSSFLSDDFSELNSRPCQGFSATAIEDLATISKNGQIRTLARMVLDYLSAKYVTQSRDLKLWGPFRRQARFALGPTLQTGDRLLGWAGALIGKLPNMGIESGLYEPEDPIPEYFGLMAALSDYRIPSLILENKFDSTASYLQIFNHRDTEIYDHGPGYLIAAGGSHRHVFGFGTSENEVQAVATVLLTDGPESRPHIIF